MAASGLRRRTYDFLELGSFAGRAAAAFEFFMIGLILANLAAVALETVPAYWEKYHHFFHWFDVVSVIIFTIEYVARVWASAERESVAGDTAFMRRVRYVLSPSALIDLLAILPFYLYLGAVTTVDLRELRVFRLLRLLKLVRYSPALSSLGRVIYAERRALIAALIIMMGLLFFAATIMYGVEHEAQPQAFGSIPEALWWALSTLTTVGYGDVVPVTVTGKIIGGFVMIFGLAFFALPIGIVASGFSDEVHRREFVVPVGVVEDFPVFSRLPREVAHEVATRVRSLAIAPGTVLSHRMDVDNGLYFVMSGEVSAFFKHRPIPMRSGDFVGECGLINENRHQPAAVAHTRCRVMWLESTDLHMILSIYPDLGDQIITYAGERLAEFVEASYLNAEERSAMLESLEAWMQKART
ncbi:cyclic nucleotide-gated ion channel [Kordiimonas marina]|uniref:cyclic nucleotide-gated ion channel n=1 Tax=Kordiimonas marina TaxID=2872312 RepID=UPI001FF316F7|nr:cyclic nucleotide-gated ion channel [Kordiimonas marina]MCJ9429017.1 cyclic nucleotide-gated ion channel/potassium channel family protein [Kordiimonas marina]